MLMLLAALVLVLGYVMTISQADAKYPRTYAFIHIVGFGLAGVVTTNRILEAWCLLCSVYYSHQLLNLIFRKGTNGNLTR